MVPELDELGFVPLSTTGAELLFEVFSQTLRTGLRPGHHQPPLRRVDRGLRVRKTHRRAAGSLHPPRAHPGDERRELPPQGHPAQRRRVSASVGPASRRLAPRQRRPYHHLHSRTVLPVRAVRHSAGGTVFLNVDSRNPTIDLPTWPTLPPPFTRNRAVDRKRRRLPAGRRGAVVARLPLPEVRGYDLLCGGGYLWQFRDEFVEGCHSADPSLQ